MKSGKVLLSIGTVALVVFLKISLSNKKKTITKKPTANQLKNRLEEFCLSDIELAKNEFEEFIRLGFNPTDAFELTIIKRVYV